MHNHKIYDTKLSEFLDLFYKVFRNFDLAFFEETEMKNIFFYADLKKMLQLKNNFTAMKITDQRDKIM